MSKTAVVLIAEGTEEIEAVTPGDVLNRAGVDVTYAAVGPLDPIGGHHVPLRADCSIDDLGEILFDAIIIPGGGKGAENLHRSDAVSALIKRHHEAGKIIAAICASPAVVLAPLGLLEGKHATCFPGLERRFSPEVKACDISVCVDGKIVTSRGPGTAMEFSLKLVELLMGVQTAIKVGHSMLVQNF
ncbi:MAG TPA: DJ-1 family glyoxalase III [Phycisphaerales bacterium]|nr:DJ-1 family glyoxalase III [Phycisphaerales bacterium]